MTFFSLFIVSAIRYDVGKDYMDTYVFTYKKVINGANNIRMDIALMLFYRVMAFFKSSAQWIFVITSFIINWFIYKSIDDQSENCQISYWIYMCGMFYFFSMNGVRQALTISLFYYSLRYVREKNIKKYMFLNGLGCLFHTSAVIFLPLYFVLGKKIKFKFKMMLSLAVFLGGNILVPLISTFLLRTKYSMYLTNSAYSAQESFSFSMILNIVLFLLYEWSMKKKEDDKSIIYSNIHFVGIIVTLFATSLPLVMRVFVSFRFIEFLSVPHLINIQPRRKYRQLINAAVLAIYFVYFIWGVYVKNGNAVLPYQTVF